MMFFNAGSARVAPYSTLNIERAREKGKKQKSERERMREREHKLQHK